MRSKVKKNRIAYSVYNKTDSISSFQVDGDGRTRIGVSKPKQPHTDAMLSVDGKIVGRSLYILKPDTWSDFVFTENRKEKLQDVKQFIDKQKHLPGMPSEEEVIQNGYNVNEMDAKLLEKIELLYLHVIDLENEIKILKGK
ncbi:MAG: hypothetical protein IPM51_17190 [Sphingobacteriaceae bacterium]|nr:hypothetical protein [Sphingobacteriaceae bacterium]